MECCLIMHTYLISTLVWLHDQWSFTHVLWQYTIPCEILYVPHYLIVKCGSEEAEDIAVHYVH